MIPDVVGKLLQEKVQEVRYDLLLAYLRRMYVGDHVSTSSSAFTECTQIHRVQNREVMDAVADYHFRFDTCLALIPADVPFPVPLAQTFIGNAAPALREQLLLAGYVPPRVGPTTTNQEQLVHSTSAMESLRRAEQAVDNIQRIAGVAGSSRRSVSFAAVPGIPVGLACPTRAEGPSFSPSPTASSPAFSDPSPTYSTLGDRYDTCVLAAAPLADVVAHCFADERVGNGREM